MDEIIPVDSKEKLESEPASVSSKQFRYTHAKCDPAHCTVPGLFQALQKGTRKAEDDFVCNPYSITHEYGDVTLVFRCSTLLGADDLRVLQGLLAIGSPLSDSMVLTTDSPQERYRKIRNQLNLTDSCMHLETLVVRGSCYQLAKEIGLRTDGANTFRRIRASIERLCGISIIAIYADGTHHGYHLIAGYSSEESKKEINVALNPRLTAAVLGKRIKASGGYTRIEMDEVRRIKGEATRVLHTYLCALVSPGESKVFLASTLRAHIWLQVAKPKDKAAHAKWHERIKKQHQRIRLAMNELNSIGWRCSLLASNRPSSNQPHYIKWEVCRPAMLEANPVSKCETDVPIVPPCPTAQEEVVANSNTEIAMEKYSVQIRERDLAELVKIKPATAIRDFGEKLSDEQFSFAAVRQPVAAIKHGLHRLTDEQFSSAANRAPGAAMRYALDRLTSEQLAKTAQQDPETAIRFAIARLTPEQFVDAAKSSTWPVGNPAVSEPQLDAWFHAHTDTAVSHAVKMKGLEFDSFAELIGQLSPTRVASCARRWHTDALRCARLIPKNLLVEIARENPSEAIKMVGDILPPEVIEECILKAPSAAITYRFALLTPDQRKWCLRKSPWTACALHDRHLTSHEREICREAIDRAIPGKIDVMIRECPQAALQFARMHLTMQQAIKCDDAIRNRSL